MNTLKVLLASTITTVALSGTALAGGGAATPDCSQQNPMALSQLPLIPGNLTVLGCSRATIKVKGSWRVTDKQGVVSQRGCYGGQTGPCTSFLAEKSSDACFVGTLDLARYLGIVKPGVYSLCWVTEAGEVLLGPVELTIEMPQGSDKEVYEQVLLPGWEGSNLARDDWEGWLVGGYSLGKPSAFSIILDRFPTSTYAGYALRQKVPSLAQSALACLNNPDETLKTWGNRGGGEENMRGHIAEAQGDMRAYAKNAGSFLKAHPDFPHAARIRRAYAMCLGLTGHLPEAMAEIQTLTTGTGKEADEAKSFLAAKDVGTDGHIK